MPDNGSLLSKGRATRRKLLFKELSFHRPFLSNKERILPLLRGAKRQSAASERLIVCVDCAAGVDSVEVTLVWLQSRQPLTK